MTSEFLDFGSFGYGEFSLNTYNVVYLRLSVWCRFNLGLQPPHRDKLIINQAGLAAKALYTTRRKIWNILLSSEVTPA